MEEIKLKAKIDRERRMVILTPDDPRAREGIKEEMPFEVFYKWVNEIERKIARSHRA